jgi:dTDP-4-dehydrorhamnose reductase
MESLLVAGVDTMVGVNFAAQLADQFDVSTCGWRVHRTVAGCRALDDSRQLSSPEAILQKLNPRRLVLCPPGANSGWETVLRPEPGDIASMERWLRAACQSDVAVTLISSDAVFTGPWMFHAENSASLCPSPEATILRQIEQLATDLMPESLVLRTNAFGWSSPWLETTLLELQAGRGCQADCVRHGSPILVNDLVDITLKAWQAGLAGVYHVAGAERCNPRAFAQKLAAEFGCQLPGTPTIASLTNCSSGYGCSETSLQTRKIRRALGIAAPLLNDGLRKLRMLEDSGFRERLKPTDKLTPTRAA